MPELALVVVSDLQVAKVLTDLLDQLALDLQVAKVLLDLLVVQEYLDLQDQSVMSVVQALLQVT